MISAPSLTGTAVSVNPKGQVAVRRCVGSFRRVIPSKRLELPAVQQAGRRTGSRFFSRDGAIASIPGAAEPKADSLLH